LALLTVALALAFVFYRGGAVVAGHAAAFVCFAVLGLTNAPLALAPSAVSMWAIAAAAAQASRAHHTSKRPT
jgi:hypothetical protein